MSETNETSGRCRSEVDMGGLGGPATNAIADAIDRLAADVAVIKAKVDDIVPEDDGRFVPSELEWNELVDRKTAAIRERDEARAEVEKLKELRDVANRLYGAEQAKVERLRKELEQRQPAGNSPKIQDSSPAAPQPAAPPAGWLTAEERARLRFTLDLLRRLGYSPAAEAIESILSRAGSPPVVEVPSVDELVTPAFVVVRAYRAAMDRAGVAWKEVGRE